MKKKKVLTIVLTALLFLSAVLLGVTSTFRVDTVTVKFSLISAEGKAQAERIQAALTKEYEGVSTFSLQSDKAKEIVAEYPYFRMIDFQKKTPDKVWIQIVEDGEVFAVEGGENFYYIVDDKGIVVEKRNNAVNRFDGKDNLIIKGVTVSGQKGTLLLGDDCWNTMLNFCKALDTELGGIRKNILVAEVSKRAPELFFHFQMREGVSVYIGSPETLTAEKAKKAFDAYMALSDVQRTGGSITVAHVEGEVFAEYSAA